MKVSIEKEWGRYCLVIKYGEKLSEDIQKLINEEYSTVLRIPLLLGFAVWFSCSSFVYFGTKIIQNCFLK